VIRAGKHVVFGSVADEESMAVVQGIEAVGTSSVRVPLAMAVPVLCWTGLCCAVLCWTGLDYPPAPFFVPPAG
jgi:hypothetical protein